MFVYDLLQIAVYALIDDWTHVVKYVLFATMFAALIEFKKKVGQWL